MRMELFIKIKSWIISTVWMILLELKKFKFDLNRKNIIYFFLWIICIYLISRIFFSRYIVLKFGFIFSYIIAWFFLVLSIVISVHFYVYENNKKVKKYWLIVFVILLILWYFPFINFDISYRVFYSVNKWKLVELNNILSRPSYEMVYSEEWVEYIKNRLDILRNQLYIKDIEYNYEYIKLLQKEYFSSDYWIIKIKSDKWKEVIKEWTESEIDWCTFKLLEELWDEWHRYECR